MKNTRKIKRAFTLIELLVVVAIIGLLATLVIINVISVKQKSRDSKRAADITSINQAIKAYYVDNNSYPATPTGCSPTSGSAYIGSSNSIDMADSDCKKDDFIAGISSYLPTLPKDPGPALISGGINIRGYGYMVTNNVSKEDYKIAAFMPENCSDERYKNIVDPSRDGGTNSGTLEYGTGYNCWTWSFYSPGGANW